MLYKSLRIPPRFCRVNRTNMHSSLLNVSQFFVGPASIFRLSSFEIKELSGAPRIMPKSHFQLGFRLLAFILFFPASIASYRAYRSKSFCRSQKRRSVAQG
jgi:hypothetical protein